MRSMIRVYRHENGNVFFVFIQLRMLDIIRNIFVRKVETKYVVDDDSIHEAITNCEKYVNEMTQSHDYFAVDGSIWTALREINEIKGSKSRFVQYLDSITYDPEEEYSKHASKGEVVHKLVTAMKIKLTMGSVLHVAIPGVEVGDPVFVVRAFSVQDGVRNSFIVVMPTYSLHVSTTPGENSLLSACKQGSVCLVSSLRGIKCLSKSSEPSVQDVFDTCSQTVCDEVNYSHMSGCNQCDDVIDDRKQTEIFEKAIADMTSVETIADFSFYCPTGNSGICQDVMFRVTPGRVEERSEGDRLIPTFQIMTVFSEKLLQKGWLKRKDDENCLEEHVYEELIKSDYFEKNESFQPVLQKLIDKQHVCVDNVTNEVVMRRIVERLVKKRGYEYTRVALQSDT